MAYLSELNRDTNKGGRNFIVYKLMAALSAIIRNFYLPNPFHNLEYGMLINIMIEPILFIFTYATVGTFYQRNSRPALGSFLYLVLYSLHICLIILWGCFNFGKTAGITIITVYFLFLTLVKVWQHSSYKRMYS